MIAIQKSGLVAGDRVFPMRHSVAELAEIADGFAVADGVVPNKTRRGIDERIAAAVTARPAGEAALHVIRDHGGISPFMAIGAQDAAAVSVIQQHKIADELVFIRRHALAELNEVGIAVAFGHVAENLVVGTIFLDDVNDVLEHARLANALRHRAKKSGR